MKFINTLIPDIYSLVQRKDGWFDNELAEAFSKDVAQRLQAQFKERDNKGTLRLSKMGEQCPCALWYSVHHPELEEKSSGPNEIKFSNGHIIEAYTLMLARASGHEVTGEQDAVYVDGITGHRDCIIDGCLVDVKSVNARSFQKYQRGDTEEIDAFGVLSQLDGYMAGSLDDPLLRVKDRAYILAVDKELGKLHLHEHRTGISSGRTDQITRRVGEYKEIVGRVSPPACNCKVELEGASGNYKLHFTASYNPFKFCCFPQLRTFIYKGKAPVYLTKVVRKPDALEVNKDGRPVYN